MNTEELLTNYISKELAIGRSKKIEPDDDLFSNGVLDSLAVLQLVMFIEERYSIKVSDEDVVYENFKSISTIAQYIDQNGNSS